MTPLFLPLLAVLAAHATRVQVDTVACPIGGSPTKVYEKVVSNTLGGFDSDLAAYSDKGQFRQYAVSTCPDNLVSLYGRDMRKTMDEATFQEKLGELVRKQTYLNVKDVSSGSGGGHILIRLK